MNICFFPFPFLVSTPQEYWLEFFRQSRDVPKATEYNPEMKDV